MAKLQLFVGSDGAVGLWGGGVACSTNGWLAATLMHGSDGLAWLMLGLFGVLFPLGLIVNAVRTVRWVALLRHGRLAYGRLVEKESIGSSRDRRYRLTFEYRDVEEERLYQPHHLPRRWGKVVLQQVGSVTDEPEEPLLFDPKNPENIQMLDALPGWLRVAHDGGIEGRAWYVVLMLFIAAVTLGSLVTLLMWLQGTIQPLLGL